LVVRAHESARERELAMDLAPAGPSLDAAPAVPLVPGVPRRDRRVRRRRSRPRSKTFPRRLTLDETAQLAAHLDAEVAGEDLVIEARPLTRAECREHQGPCPWVACKHHLYLDINPVTGSIKLNFPDLEPWELEHTCALDVAEAGALTLERIGEVTNLTRERVRQVESIGLAKLALLSRRFGLAV
jgi:hypothetical protein